jgi:hypothetical protein
VTRPVFLHDNGDDVFLGTIVPRERVLLICDLYYGVRDGHQAAIARYGDDDCVSMGDPVTSDADLEEAAQRARMKGLWREP